MAHVHGLECVSTFGEIICGKSVVLSDATRALANALAKSHDRLSPDCPGSCSSDVVLRRLRRGEPVEAEARAEIAKNDDVYNRTVLGIGGEDVSRPTASRAARQLADELQRLHGILASDCGGGCPADDLMQRLRAGEPVEAVANEELAQMQQGMREQAQFGRGKAKLVAQEYAASLTPPQPRVPAPAHKPAGPFTERATRTRDRLTGRSWLDFGSRPSPEVIAELKANGWRWSGFRKQWHHPRATASAPKSVEVENGGTVDYAEERGDRLEARAEKAQAKGDARFAATQRIAEIIPLGQPVLLGHHSEGRHRRDLERIRGGYDKAFTEMKKADRLESAAAASRRHQDRLLDAGAIVRRIAKLEDDLAAAVRNGREDTAAILRERLVEQREFLSEAGGSPVEASASVQRGDLIKIHGHEVRVLSVGPKSISGVIEGGGANGMGGKWDRSKFQEILAKATPEQAAKKRAVASKATRPTGLYNEGHPEGYFVIVADYGGGRPALKVIKKGARKAHFASWADKDAATWPALIAGWRTHISSR